MRRSLGLKFWWKMETTIDETYHVASCLHCPQYVREVLGENSLLHLSFIIKDNNNSPHGKFHRFLFPLSIFTNVMSLRLPLCHPVQRKSAYKLLDSGAEKLFFRAQHQLLTFESFGER